MMRIQSGLAIATIALATAAWGQDFELISQDSGGSIGNADSGFDCYAPGTQVPNRLFVLGRTTVISADGRWVVFSSIASDLVSGDTNAVRDVFVRDRVSGTTIRVSVATDGTQADADSAIHTYADLNGTVYPMPDRVDISDDGRFVVFSSWATNLVQNDANDEPDVFLRDRDADENGVFDEPGQSTTVCLTGSVAGDKALAPMMTADGSTTLYVRSDSDYSAWRARGADQQGAEVFSGGNLPIFAALSYRSFPAISGDGRYVYVIASPVGGPSSVRHSLCDLSTGIWVINRTIVSGFGYWCCDIEPSFDGAVFASTIGMNNWDGTSSEPSVSRRTPAIRSLPIDGYFTSLPVSSQSWQGSISPDGRFLAFATDEQRTADDTDSLTDIYLWDSVDAANGDPAFSRITAWTGGGSNDDSRAPALADLALSSVFESESSNLVTGDNNVATDIFGTGNIGGLREGWAELVFVVDNSNSMQDANRYRNTLTGLRNALGNGQYLPRNGTVAITLVRVDTFGVDNPIGWYHLDSDQDASDLQAQIDCLMGVAGDCTRAAGDDEIASGIDLASTLFWTNDFTATPAMITYVGNGGSNTNGCGNTELQAARDAAIASGVFRIDALAIGLNGWKTCYEDNLVGPSGVGFAYETDEGAANIQGGVRDFMQGVVCPGDFNRDGSANTIDFIAYLNAWSVGDPLADYSGDGIVNTVDYIAFLAANTAGCD